MVETSSCFYVTNIFTIFIFMVLNNSKQSTLSSEIFQFLSLFCKKTDLLDLLHFIPGRISGSDRVFPSPSVFTMVFASLQLMPTFWSLMLNLCARCSFVFPFFCVLKDPVKWLLCYIGIRFSLAWSNGALIGSCLVFRNSSLLRMTFGHLVPRMFLRHLSISTWSVLIEDDVSLQVSGP